MSGAPLRTKVVFGGYGRKLERALVSEIESELILRAALTDRRAVLMSNPSPDGAGLFIEMQAWASMPAPWALASAIGRFAWWPPALFRSPLVKFGLTHPLLIADEMRFANRGRVVEWLEVEIDAALEKRLLSGR